MTCPGFSDAVIQSRFNKGENMIIKGKLSKEMSQTENITFDILEEIESWMRGKISRAILDDRIYSIIHNALKKIK
jgi:hypothetical protein